MIHSKQLYPPERATFLDLTMSIIQRVSWVGDCCMLPRLAYLWILLKKFIIKSSWYHSWCETKWLLQVTRNILTVFGVIAKDHFCVVWGFICCVGDGCVWNTKWPNDQFNWCYGWESLWDTAVWKSFFLFAYNYYEELITAKSVIILCHPEHCF